MGDGLDTWVPLRRARWRAVVVGEHPDLDRAENLEQVWRLRPVPRTGDDAPLPWGPDGEPEDAAPRWRPSHEFGPYQETRWLWVDLLPGQPSRGLPSMEEVADLDSASFEKWAEFVSRFGLPMLEPRFLVGRAWGVLRLRLPHSWLLTLAETAKFLLSAERALAGRAYGELLREWHQVEDYGAPCGDDAPAHGPPPDPDTEELLSFGRPSVAMSIEDAWRQLEPSFDPSTVNRGPGIPGEWALYAWGWWPLVVLDRYLFRSRRLPSSPEICASPTCSQPVPPNRRSYCSDRCRQREKKQRNRYRRKLGAGQKSVVATRARTRSPAGR